MPVSTINRSLALEEINGSAQDLEELLHLRNLSISNVSTEDQPACQVVKVGGSITVSF